MLKLLIDWLDDASRSGTSEGPSPTGPSRRLELVLRARCFADLYFFPADGDGHLPPPCTMPRRRTTPMPV